MEIEAITFQAGDETLVGHIIRRTANDKPHMLFLHGAGQATKERTKPLAIQLAQHGIASVAFDFSGHGGSSGSLEQSSLSKRTREAHAAFQFLDDAGPLTLCAFSMGGHIALELLKRNPRIATLLLFAPAVFDRETFDVPFNAGFTAIIRRENSWMRTDATDALETFAGTLLICIGQDDEVIPKGVITLLDERSPHASKKQIVILPDAPHQIAKWTTENADASDRITRLMLDFLAS